MKNKGKKSVKSASSKSGFSEAPSEFVEEFMKRKDLDRKDIQSTFEGFHEQSKLEGETRQVLQHGASLARSNSGKAAAQLKATQKHLSEIERFIAQEGGDDG